MDRTFFLILLPNGRILKQGFVPGQQDQLVGFKDAKIDAGVSLAIGVIKIEWKLN
ncbi:hypothetical protein HPP92_028167 [Vanilla planifolia]|uniref:Uncharacterized protein n=1 Tax=Vanilla planifolia TaxID=51239 RepID=A0A835U4S5_VANPL|nr:hypothetical protein HPP92_028167 [Vanilla planifolia]KAG0447835.1 hypothetical protein HPP92_028145 [Vanilla planifolia]